MRNHVETLNIRTAREFDVIDITSDVEKALVNSEVNNGFTLVFSPHTTCGVLVNEKEEGLLADIRSTLARIVPNEDGYQHDDFAIRTENMHPDETKNAHAHLRHLLGGKSSEFIPVSNAGLLLGQWQRVMVVEYDRAREREIVIQVCGS